MELNDCNKTNQILNEDMLKNQITLHEKHLAEKKENLPEELKNNFEDRWEQEHFINENEPQNAVFINEIEDMQMNILQSAQIQNETTPNSSDDENCLKIPSSPTKKKKHISNKAILLPKQLKYSVKEIKNTSTIENFLPETDVKNSKTSKCKIEMFSTNNNIKVFS